jgi:hypothetical protein
MASVFVTATIVLAGIAAILSAGLLITFLNSYRKVRAPFTMALVLVAAFFTAQNALFVYAFMTMMAELTEFVSQLLTVVMTFGCIALGALLWVSQK